MFNSAKYRLVSFSLAILFGIFNIGIPIVVASCPMAKYGPVCNSCFEPGTGNERISKYQDTSCCATIIAAERNTNEFLSAAGSALDVVRTLVISMPAEVVSESRFVEPSYCILQSPVRQFPPGDDLPILHSSLLI